MEEGSVVYMVSDLFRDLWARHNQRMKCSCLFSVSVFFFSIRSKNKFLLKSSLLIAKTPKIEDKAERHHTIFLWAKKYQMEMNDLGNKFHENVHEIISENEKPNIGFDVFFTDWSVQNARDRAVRTTWWGVGAILSTAADMPCRNCKLERWPRNSINIGCMSLF